jgi:hypothetical protein
MINSESTTTASGQKLLEDSTASESNDNKLLGDEFNTDFSFAKTW